MPRTLRRATLTLLALALPVLAGTAAAAPQSTTPAPGAAGQQSPLPGPAARARAIQQQLMQIRAATLEANPDLESRQEALGDLVRETMRESGHTPEADIAKMGEIRDSLEDEGMSAEERETLVQEFQQLRATFMGARQQAMADSEVQDAGAAFQQALLTAMREQDPRTDTLMQRMSTLQQQFGG